MKNLNVDIFDRVTSVAHKSTMVFKHGTVIVKNGEIISEGYNHLADFMCHQWSVHSEVDAILNLKKNHRNKKFLEDAVMIVVRIGAKNDMRMSKPCDACKKAIEKAGIKRILYSM